MSVNGRRRAASHFFTFRRYTRNNRMPRNRGKPDSLLEKAEC